MKKILASVVMSLSLFAGTSLAAMPPASTPSQFCGWDFERSALNEVPLFYCWTKQDLGDVTYNGFLSVACSGTACRIPNNVLTELF